MCGCAADPKLIELNFLFQFADFKNRFTLFVSGNSIVKKKKKKKKRTSEQRNKCSLSTEVD